ncbi:transducin/WD40 repeat-like superfamily protein [Artemisia annua]|uniref:Transducin/WD40 repeat-like superfamily protein n=1 Tax=Artemisia annua TaxID=35608 RepID=A0A2U1N1M9_ARTAN|nr:transducin/WD40 repeat-like superfamily protein [Artemisia annua]
MPRTTTVESAGCPPLRALTFDNLGLIKVTEARSKQGGFPKIVEKWGDPDSSRCVLATSINDRKVDPLLAVARKNGVVELLSPINGDIRVSLPSDNQAKVQPDVDNIVGLHLFKKQTSESSSRPCKLLTCTMKGLTTLKSVTIPKSLGDSTSDDTPTTWNVCGAGNVLCCKVDESENYGLFGGKGVEVNIWDLTTHTKIWQAKSPPKNSLGIFTPTWFTAATFLSKDDHRKFVGGTNSHQVHLYDMAAQRRPVMSFKFRETPIKAVTEDLDGNTIYIGNGSGDLASVDIRTGKLLGCFLGKCSGSIRSIARHPDLPVLASCGLDSYLRIWDIKSRQLLSAVFLKQHLTSVVFDSHFDDEEVAGSLATQLPNEQNIDDESIDRDEDSPPAKRKKKKSKSSTVDGDEEGDISVKRKKAKKSPSSDANKEVSESAKQKKAKRLQSVEGEEEESGYAEVEITKKAKDRKSKKKSKKPRSESIDV